MSLLSVRAHVRLFRFLLLAYPKRFRTEFGDEMAALFESRLARRRSGSLRGSVTGLWLRTVRDAVVTAVLEWWEVLRSRESRGTKDERRRVTMFERIGQDIQVAVRRLVRTPGFTLAAVLIAALGIGANTAAFTLVDALLFRPPPFADVDRVVRIFQDSDDGDPNSSSYPATRDMSRFPEIFSGVAAWSPDGLTWDAPDGLRPVAIEYVTSEYLSVLGLAPSMGRWFESAHDRVGAGAYAVLSHPAWRTKFGSDPGIVGSTIRLNGQPVTILGVGPASFNGSGGALVTDMWLSISSTVLSGSYRVSNLDRREDHWYYVWARLAPGVTLAQSQSAMNALATRLAEEYPELNKGRDITVFQATDVRVSPDVDGSLRSAGTVLMLVMGMVLLLACANLAGLLLVRGMARSSEVAVRRALGASRRRVAGLLLTEALLLATLGGALGLLVARWLVAALPGLPLPIPGGAELEIGIDARVLAFTVLLVLVTGTLFGLAPSLRAAGVDLSGTLRRDVRSASHGRRVPLLRNGLLVVQVAVSLVLLVGSGLLVRSLANLGHVDAGVDTEHLAYIALNPGQAGMSAEQGGAAIDEARTRLEAIPGISSVVLASRLPVQDRGGSSTTVIEGYAPESGTGSVELLFAAVGPGYFETAGIPVRSGRGFTDADLVPGVRVVVVNETAARRYWGAEDPVGRRIRPQGSPDYWIQVIGVAGDSKIRSVGEAPTPMMYRPLARGGAGPIYLLARTAGAAGPIADAMRSEIRSALPSLPIAEVGTLDDSIRRGLASPRAAAATLAGFSVIAMLLTALGIHAVLSFVVARRSAELGIRMALGARRSSVIAAVVGEVLLTVIVGLAAGAALAAAVAVRIENLLFDVHGLDPLAFAAAAILLLAVAGMAAFLPARKAVGIDPVEALRAQV